MLKIPPFRHHLYKAPSDQMKFKNKGPCFHSQIASYKKSNQGNLFQELAKRNAIKSTIIGWRRREEEGRRREGEEGRRGERKSGWEPVAGCPGQGPPTDSTTQGRSVMASASVDLDERLKT